VFVKFSNLFKNKLRISEADNQWRSEATLAREQKYIAPSSPTKTADFQQKSKCKIA